MTRGTYSAVRDQGRGAYAEQDAPLVRWTVGRAVDRRIDPTRQRVAGAALDALRAGRSVGQIWNGSQAFRDRGETSTARVGAEWFHTMADRERALRQLTAQFDEFFAEVAAAVKRHAVATNLVWFTSDVVPAVARWQAFAQNQRASRWTQAATNWRALEAWWTRLRSLREFARARGISLQSPEPSPLPKTAWEKIEAGEGNPMMSWLGVGKLVLFGGMTVLGISRLYGVVRGRWNSDCAMGEA